MEDIKTIELKPNTLYQTRRKMYNTKIQFSQNGKLKIFMTNFYKLKLQAKKSRENLKLIKSHLKKKFMEKSQNRNELAIEGRYHIIKNRKKKFEIKYYLNYSFYIYNIKMHLFFVSFAF